MKDQIREECEKMGEVLGVTVYDVRAKMDVACVNMEEVIISDCVFSLDV